MNSGYTRPSPWRTGVATSDSVAGRTRYELIKESPVKLNEAQLVQCVGQSNLLAGQIVMAGIYGLQKLHE